MAETRGVPSESFVRSTVVRRPGRVGTPSLWFQIGAGGHGSREDTRGVSERIRSDGLAKFVETTVIPKVDQVGGVPWVLLWAPRGYDGDGDIEFSARLEGGTEGHPWTDRVDDAVKAGHLLKARGIDARVYLGALRRDRFANMKTLGPAVVTAELWPWIAGGWSIILDASARERRGSLTWRVAMDLASAGVLNGVEPWIPKRVGRNAVPLRAPWEKLECAAWAVQFWNASGAARGLLRSLGERHQDGGIRLEKWPGPVGVLPAHNPSRDQFFPDYAMPMLLAAGFDVPDYGYRPRFTMDELRERTIEESSGPVAGVKSAEWLSDRSDRVMVLIDNVARKGS